MAQKSNLTIEEFEAKLREVMDYIYDIYLPNDCYVQNMTGAPMYAAFCDENKESVSNTTIILMAFQIICKRYGFVYWHCVDDWVKRFKEVVISEMFHKDDEEELRNAIETQFMQ